LATDVYIVDNLGYSYPGGISVLDGISFTVTEGESIAILGANASGKSTLLHILDGLYFPSTGQVSAFGTVLTEVGVETPPFSRHFRQNVGFLFQNSDAQLFCTTVEEELAFGPLQLRLTPDEVECRVTDVLRMLQIEHLRGRSPGALSGGEKKKVALAAVLACGPRVILLDEPSTGLDPRTQQWLIEFIGLLRDSGITLITSCHDLSFVAETSERTLILSEDHRLIYNGPTKQALADLDMLLSANLIHAHAHKHDGTVHEHPHLHEAWHEHEHHTH